jgi:hypothetical protein
LNKIVVFDSLESANAKAREFANPTQWYPDDGARHEKQPKSAILRLILLRVNFFLASNPKHVAIATVSRLPYRPEEHFISLHSSSQLIGVSIGVGIQSRPL